MSSEEELGPPGVDPNHPLFALTRTWVIFCSVICFIGLVASIYILKFSKLRRNNPLVIIRFPDVLLMDLATGFINGIVVSFSFTRYWTVHAGCQPLEGIFDGLDCMANTMMIGRTCLVYMQAKSMDHMGKNRFLDKVVDIIAFATAPGEYFRLKKFTTKINIWDDKLHPKKFELTSIQRYIVAQSCWFLVGFLYAFLPTISNMGSDVWVYDQESDILNPDGCWNEFVLPYSGALYVIVSVISMILLFRIWPISDLAGLRNDLVSGLLVTVCCKSINAGFVLATEVPSYDPTVATYPLGCFLPSLISLLVMIFFVRKHTTIAEKLAATDNADVKIKTLQDFMKLWETEDGKVLIMQLARKMYVQEIIIFLRDTDEQQHYTYGLIFKLWKTFIDDNAPWELNISGDMREEVKKCVAYPEEAKEHAAEVLKKIRLEMFKILFPMMQPVLYRYKQESLESITTDAPRSSSVSATGGAGGGHSRQRSARSMFEIVSLQDSRDPVASI